MQSKRKLLLITFLLGIFTLTAAGCSNPAGTIKTGNKLKVVTSVYPIYEFTRKVGGEKVETTMLVPPGVEPHDWEPTAKEILELKSAKLFLYHGAGFESTDKLITKENLGDVRAVAVSTGIPVLPPEEGLAHDNHSDSHIWLDPVYAQQEVATIAEALSEVDPQNSDYYRKNADNLKAQLALLDSDYKSTLAALPRKDIITSHAAFGYLAKRYNLRQVAIMGLSPDSEPTPEKMAQIVDFCRKHAVKYIFFETIVNPKLSETIAAETGAGLLVLNPIESLTPEEISQGKDYLSIMRDNLQNLKKALAL